MNENEQAAFIMAQCACAIIKAMGMVAENKICEIQQEYPKFDQSDFLSVIDEHKIEWNDVLGYLKGMQ